MTSIVSNRHRQHQQQPNGIGDDDDNNDNGLDKKNDEQVLLTYTDETQVINNENNMKIRKRKQQQQSKSMKATTNSNSNYNYMNGKNHNNDGGNTVMHVIGIAFIIALIFLCYEYSQSRLQHDHKRRIEEQIKRGAHLWVQKFHNNIKDSSQQLDPLNKHLLDLNENDEQGLSMQKRFELYRKSLIRNENSNDEMKVNSLSRRIRSVLMEWFQQQDYDIRNNIHGGVRWIRPYLLPPHPDHIHDDEWQSEYVAEVPSSHHNHHNKNHHNGGGGHNHHEQQQHKGHDQQEAQRHLKQQDDIRFFKIDRDKLDTKMKWEEEYEVLEKEGKIGNGPPIDYTNTSLYTYPTLILEPPIDGTYPPLQTLQNLMNHFPQDNDYPMNQLPIKEGLLHFDYTNPIELQAAALYRDAELPFKLINVPEVVASSKKWTDEYLSINFGKNHHGIRGFLEQKQQIYAKGTTQESPNSFFAFFVAPLWNVEIMGLPPVQNNDWSYDKFSKHALYSDTISLSSDQPHFYWQSGVDREERYLNENKWTFISKDLPSFSSTTENFFMFHPEYQKGIQCRFGERGVVAATHYDSGRNMIAMIRGAKRYILSPPNQCSKLGIFTSKRSSIGRHSLLNFGHLQYLNNTKSNNNNNSSSDMSKEERAWLERSATSLAVETILKSGEVLYVPSHWFHYIVSLQKSAQCNARSGIAMEGDPHFGGKIDVEECSI